MSKIEIYLPNINFTIITSQKYEETIKKALSESIIPYRKDNDKYIQIEYIVDENQFIETLHQIKLTKGKIYDSFKNQKHKEVCLNNIFYYLVDTEEYICIKKDNLNYKILVKENNDISLNWIIRIIRELYLREKEDLGFDFMHGTALEIDGKGILLLGNSGSGKTTLAVKILELNKEKSFLSNDRVLIDKNLNIDYFPHAITYAMGTVKNNKHLDKYFRENRLLEKKKNISYENASNDIDCNTPLSDVAKVFNLTNTIARTKLDYIIYPRFDKKFEKVEIIHMSEDEKRIFLEETNFTPDDKESLRKPWIRKREKNRSELLEIRETLINNIIKNVSIKKIKYGTKTKIEDILKIL